MDLKVGLSTKDCNDLSYILKYKETIADSDKEGTQDGERLFIP